VSVLFSALPPEEGKDVFARQQVGELVIVAGVCLYLCDEFILVISGDLGVASRARSAESHRGLLRAVGVVDRLVPIGPNDAGKVKHDDEH
jgi:hypothetical protein